MKVRSSAAVPLAVLAVLAAALGPRLAGHAGHKTSASHELQPSVSSGLLTAPYSYGEGTVRLNAVTGPVPATAVTSGGALAAFQATGLYGPQTASMSPQIFLASLTSYQRSTTATAAGALVPSIANDLVWVVRYQGVEDISAGAGANAGGSDGTTPSPVQHDVIAIVDAASGTLEQVLSASPDDPVEAAPLASATKP